MYVNMSKHIFTPMEKKYFIELLKKVSHIVENKNTDGATLKAKAMAWDQLTREYNASEFATIQATPKQMRRLWLNMKQRRKEMLAKERQRLIAAGTPMSAAEVEAELIETAPDLNVCIDDIMDSDSIQVKGEYSADMTDHSSFFDSTQNSHDFTTHSTPPVEPSPPQSPSGTPPQTAPTSPKRTSLSMPSLVYSHRHKNSVLHMEYRDRKGRNDEKHQLELEILRIQLREATDRADNSKRDAEKFELEKELLQYKVREAKANAELAELKLQEQKYNGVQENSVI